MSFANFILKLIGRPAKQNSSEPVSCPATLPPEGGSNFSPGPSDPRPRSDPWWFVKHEQFNTNTANNPNIPIIFFGASITEWWGTNGASVFKQYYEPLGVANYGIIGDRTEHLLWRVQNGEVKGLNPRLIVLHIGGNNLDNGNAAIAGGVKTIVNTLRQMLPNTKILVLGIIPRNGKGAHEKISEINSIIADVQNGSTVFFLDMFETFSESWGVIRAEYFCDGLHLTTEGYQKWAETMNPFFNQLIA